MTEYFYLRLQTFEHFLVFLNIFYLVYTEKASHFRFFMMTNIFIWLFIDILLKINFAFLIQYIGIQSHFEASKKKEKKKHQ